ncbi:hypothetical protein NPIL_539021 [Nephila pilipes]|uniref:Uncharacterized protein n=1 Tax=Nephila pilipes TaxID=299642 RepID=A0A8X6NWP5_NEPPI|nr:hypothetical protein NPIL_539021 [Nephila pilipes]
MWRSIGNKTMKRIPCGHGHSNSNGNGSGDQSGNETTEENSSGQSGENSNGDDSGDQSGNETTGREHGQLGREFQWKAEGDQRNELLKNSSSQNLGRILMKMAVEINPGMKLLKRIPVVNLGENSNGEDMEINESLKELFKFWSNSNGNDSVRSIRESKVTRRMN